MTPKLFGLAERTATGEPDPELVRIWGMEAPDGAVMYWKEGDRVQFAVFDTAADAEARFGSIFGLTLFHP